MLYGVVNDREIFSRLHSKCVLSQTRPHFVTASLIHGKKLFYYSSLFAHFVSVHVMKSNKTYFIFHRME